MDLPHLSAEFVDDLLGIVLRAARARCAGELEVTAELLLDRRVLIQTRSLRRHTLDMMTMPFLKAMDYLNALQAPRADDVTPHEGLDGKLLLVPLFLTSHELSVLTRAGGPAWISHWLRRRETLEDEH